MSRTAVVSVLLALAGLTAACGSSSPASSSSSTSSTGASESTTTGGSATPKSAPPVANATDVSKEPVISAGKAPAPTQLVVVDLVKGTGAEAGASSTVTVKYVGANYADGKVFDDTPWRQGQPIDFPLSQVIKGFAQGITGMRVGGRRELVIPPDLGYGAQGAGPVGPNETLVFVIDLLKVS